MGGQGILLRKVTLDKTLNQLRIFLKGAFVILLMYMINGLFIEKNLASHDIQLLVILYLAVFLCFLFLWRKKKTIKDNVLMGSIQQYFEIGGFSDVEQLDKELIKEIKNKRKFVVNNGQIVGTEKFILFDLIDGQFKLIPVKSIQHMAIETAGGRSCLSIQTTVQTETVLFKKRSEANELIEKYQSNY